MKKQTTYGLIGVLVILILVGLTIGILYGAGVLQSTIQSGNYIQAPTFYFYKCDAASEPLESQHKTLVSGSSSGWIICPSNTDTCDLWVSQTETTKWYSNDRRIVYQICHNNGANCDPQVFISAGSFILSQKKVPSIHLPNVLLTDKVWVDYQYKTYAGLGSWQDIDGAEWYQTYKPFILWKTDMFAGGSTPYTTPTQGCTFPTNDIKNLISSVTNSIKQFNTQTSTSNTKLNFYETRNFIGTYVPISIENTKFVTYDGQQGYCLNRQVFTITTVKTNDATYQIVDNNFNTRLANSVPCCPGETEPTRKCNSNFQWENIEKAECSAFNACAGADWSVSSSKKLVRYNCVSSKCVAEYETVDCTRNSDCGNNKVCSLLTYKCENVGAGTIIPNGTTSNNSLQCEFYQEKVTVSSKDYGFLYWRFLTNNPIVSTEDKCVTATWWYMALIFGFILLFTLILVIVFLVIRRKR